MSNRIITISREFGSGGHTVGKKVAERLGIPCYDNELIQKIAEQSGFVEEYIKEEGEHVPQSSWLASAFTGWNWNGPSNQDLDDSAEYYSGARGKGVLRHCRTLCGFYSAG